MTGGSLLVSDEKDGIKPRISLLMETEVANYIAIACNNYHDRTTTKTSTEDRRRGGNL